MEYTKAKKIDYDPYFLWWLPYTLRKMYEVIMSVSSRVKNKTHKYGIEVPKNVLYAYIFYRANGNNYLSKVVVK